MTVPSVVDPDGRPVELPPPRDDQGPERIGRPARRWRGLPLPGSYGALLLVCASLTPSLLPRSGVAQGVVSGISAAMGYGLGVLAAAVWRALADRGPRPSRRWSWRVFAVATVVLGAVFFILGRRWQGDLRALMGMPAEPLGRALLAPVVALVVFAVILAVCRLVRGAAQAIARLLSRWIGPSAARALGGLAVAALAIVLVSGVAVDGLLAAADRVFALEDEETPDGVERPTSRLRSGGPGSLIGWDSLGREGRTFVAGGPSAAEIGVFTGTEAPEPIRIYSGVATDDDVGARAQAAVEDLERAGGFDRARLVVATTTGRGWLDAGSLSAFEYIAGGDSAVVAMQYSYVPSGLSYLIDQDRARAAGRELFDAVYERWTALPPDSRPELYVFGESLGSFGAEAAFSGEYDLRNRVTGALFVGPPNFNALHTEFRDGRDAGSREIEPVYREGRTVRFSNEISGGAPPTGEPWTGTRVLILQHPSDPVTWWSPSLLFERPDWLAEEPGRDVLPEMTWIPLVTFWQVTLDMPFSTDVPEGHGHRYTRESVDAWALLLRPADWTAERADRLRALIR
ncbi:alpha/beta hydrolase [Geodermatophilus normandii]|uniref:alpha/beta hydrolase n=1 Tax=Geodermatophilus normandii TaxID=1137989 RepID=UPI0023BAA06B|nr:alpha/beta-hydrolase family protein [Geodermatophilus normandii]